VRQGRMGPSIVNKGDGREQKKSGAMKTTAITMGHNWRRGW
jgi:hypothetical protein